MRGLKLISLAVLLVLTNLPEAWSHGDQPLSKIAIHKAISALHESAYVKASPEILGMKVRSNSAMFFFFKLLFFFFFFCNCLSI